jgi:YHS domain-containing protein
VEVGTRLNTESVVQFENAPFTIDDWGAPRFIPFFADVVISQKINIFVALKMAKENGVMKFKYEGNVYYGFLEEVKVRSFDRNEVTFRLKLKAGTDLIKLL